MESPLEVDTGSPRCCWPATIQNKSTGIGRLNVTSFQGRHEWGRQDRQALSFGSRSFSIWSADGALIFDSGDALEHITRRRDPNNFNASNTSNASDNRSDDKGPEPEGLTVARLFGRAYVFIVLERIGGVMVYEVSESDSRRRFVQYINTAQFRREPEQPRRPETRDLKAARSSSESSANGSPLLLVSQRSERHPARLPDRPVKISKRTHAQSAAALT